jgi:Ca-activated chloride channel family protein
MSFIWPAMLYLLLLLPLVIGVYIVLSRRRQRAAARYGTFGLAQQSQTRSLGARRVIPAFFFLLALITLFVSLARPQTVISVPRVVGTVVLAFDVSGSMAAKDMEPTRMEAAKAAAEAFIQRQPRTVQIGIVAFSDSGLTIQAPTNDQDVLLAAIKRLAPKRGTSLADGVLASLQMIATVGKTDTHFYSNLTPAPTPTPTPMPKGTYSPAAIILLSDGNNNETPDPQAAAQAAVARGVRIYTVGIGSAVGTNLDINGFTIHTQLDDTALRQISDLTNGAYYSADNAQDLLKIYQNINTQLVVKPEDTEVTSIFAGAGILFLLIGAAFSLLWLGRMP